jgi:copper chaperone
MQTQIQVENIRCGGCANSITKKLQEDERITAVTVNVEEQTVTIESTEEVRDSAIHTLFGLGYPERGTVEGLAAFKEKAKSVVSCAIGRIDLHTKG